MNPLKYRIVGLAGATTSFLAALHVVNIFLGVAGGILTLAAGYYHFRVKRAEWKKFQKDNPKT